MSDKVVFFGASWCRPCKAAWPLVERMAAEFGIELEYVDVESYDSRASSVTAIPTVRVYDEYDELTNEIRGNVSQGQLDTLFGGLA